jgi:hypothetical protein
MKPVSKALSVAAILAMIGSSHAVTSGTDVASYWTSFLQRNMTPGTSLAPTVRYTAASEKKPSLLDDIKAGLGSSNTKQHPLDADSDNNLILVAGAIMLATIVRRRISLRL